MINICIFRSTALGNIDCYKLYSKFDNDDYDDDVEKRKKKKEKIIF
jgi:hypothetical protein